MDNLEKEREGMVLRITRGSRVDGDGFRTVVFLKGCPLRCAWCSTPESHSFEVQETASNVYGKRMTVEEVLTEVRKDGMFYFMSGGGMTVSGGECLAQPEFARALLMNARREGINTTIETSFYAPWEKIRAALPYIDTAFVDIKAFSGEVHKKFTGLDNALILENIKKTNTIDPSELRPGFRLIHRIPVIPGVNNNEKELDAIGRFCKELKYLAYVQLLPYHAYGSSTYEKLGMEYKMAGTKSPTAEEMEEYRSIVGRYVEAIL